MPPQIVIQDFRPDPIHWAYWEELLDIRQDDIMLPVEFMMEDL